MGIADQEDFTTSLHVVSGAPVSPPADQPDFTRTVNVVSGGGGAAAGMLAFHFYPPANGTAAYTTAAGPYASIDPVNLTIPFTTATSGPGSTQVVILCRFVFLSAASGYNAFAILDHATQAVWSWGINPYVPPTSTNDVSLTFFVSGLTPGTGYQVDLGVASDSPAYIYADNTPDAAASTNYGPITMAVLAGPS